MASTVIMRIDKEFRQRPQMEMESVRDCTSNNILAWRMILRINL